MSYRVTGAGKTATHRLNTDLFPVLAPRDSNSLRDGDGGSGGCIVLYSDDMILIFNLSDSTQTVLFKGKDLNTPQGLE